MYYQITSWYQVISSSILLKIKYKPFEYEVY